jgi:hypothetical protein
MLVSETKVHLQQSSAILSNMDDFNKMEILTTKNKSLCFHRISVDKVKLVLKNAQSNNFHIRVLRERYCLTRQGEFE